MLQKCSLLSSKNKSNHKGRNNWSDGLRVNGVDTRSCWWILSAHFAKSQIKRIGQWAAESEHEDNFCMRYYYYSAPGKLIGFIGWQDVILLCSRGGRSIATPSAARSPCYSWEGRRRGDFDPGVDLAGSSSRPATAPMPEVERSRGIDGRCTYL